MAATHKLARPLAGPLSWRPSDRAAWHGGGAAGAAFTGILDRLSTAAAGAWSMSRALLTGYVGQPLFDLRRSSDNAALTILAGEDGEADIAALAPWAGGDTILVTRCYDQSGNGNHAAQATPGSQPFFSLSGGPNGRIAFTPNVSGRQLLVPNNAPLSSKFLPFGSFYYALLTGAQARQLPQSQPMTINSFQIDFGNAANTVQFKFAWTGGVHATWQGPMSPIANRALVLAAEYNSGSTSNKPAVYLDGSAVTLSTIVAPSGAPLAYGASDQFPHNGISTDIYCAEWIYFNAILSSGDRGALNIDMADRYKP